MTIDVCSTNMADITLIMYTFIPTYVAIILFSALSKVTPLEVQENDGPSFLARPPCTALHIPANSLRTGAPRHPRGGHVHLRGTRRARDL